MITLSPDRPEHVQVLLETAFDLCKDNPEQALSVAQEAVKNADPSLAAHTLYAVGKTYYERNQLTPALDSFNDALSYSHKTTSKPLSLEIYLSLGQTLRDLGRFDEAIENLEHSLKLAKKLKSPEAEVEASILLATIKYFQGQSSMALKYLKTCLPLAEKHQFNEKIARIYNNMGSNYCTLGLYADALESLKKANTLIHKYIPQSRPHAINLINFGQVYVAMGNIKNAETMHTQAYDISLKINDVLLQSASINHLAGLHLENKNHDAAKKRFQEGLSLAKKESLKQHEINNLLGLGQTYHALNLYQESLDIDFAGLTLAREIGDLQGEIEIQLHIVKNYSALERYSEALRVLAEVQIIDLTNYPKAVYEVHQFYAEIYAQQKDYEKAFYHHQTYHTLKINSINEETNQKTRELSIQFEVEQAHQKAEDYRVRTEIEHTARQIAESEVQDRTNELEGTRIEIVNRLAMAGEYRDDATGEHTRRVGRNAAIIAYMLGWPEEEVQLIFYAARLHDVGKIGIRDSILLKPDKLTPEEMVMMRSHTAKGAGILSGGQSRLLQMAEEIALSHHEKWDGTGYPHKLSETDIPLTARIVAVADVLDALTHQRVYKDAWSLEDALAEIKNQSGLHFDPLMVEIALRAFTQQDIIQQLNDSDWKSFYSSLDTLLQF